jgi:NADPH2:quinone reductase
MKTMAIQVREVGGPEKLGLAEVELPDPGPGFARIRLERIGVNFIDTYHRSGLYPLPLPFVPGVEAAGVVESIGPDVAEVAVGDRVAFALVPGSYAGACLAPARQLVRLPAALSFDLAAASLLQGMTAHYLTHGVRTPRPGDTALVHAAAGGTGGLLIQCLKAAGVKVIGTCSSEAKAALARAAGADEVVRYDREDFRERARAWTGGRGVDVVYDSVGRSTFEGSLGCLRPRGLLCLFGQASGPVPPFDLGRLNGAGSLFVTRPSLGHYVATRAELETRAGWVFDALVAGRLRAPIDGHYALADAATAHRDLESRRTTGKLLLDAV